MSYQLLPLAEPAYIYNVTYFIPNVIYTLIGKIVNITLKYISLYSPYSFIDLLWVYSYREKRWVYLSDIVSNDIDKNNISEYIGKSILKLLNNKDYKEALQLHHDLKYHLHVISESNPGIAKLTDTYAIFEHEKDIVWGEIQTTQFNNSISIINAKSINPYGRIKWINSHWTSTHVIQGCKISESDTTNSVCLELMIDDKSTCKFHKKNELHHISYIRRIIHCVRAIFKPTSSTDIEEIVDANIVHTAIVEMSFGDTTIKIYYPKDKKNKNEAKYITTTKNKGINIPESGCITYNTETRSREVTTDSSKDDISRKTFKKRFKTVNERQYITEIETLVNDAPISERDMDDFRHLTTLALAYIKYINNDDPG